MKKTLIFLMFLLLCINIYSENESLYKDLSREHWAYNAIENLVYKGIIDVEDDFFNGEENISKYDFVYMLSKVLNKLDSEKASKDDFLIVENLVYEFSKDLTSFGFDSHEYISKIKDLENDYQKINSETLKYENAIKILSNRIKNLEENGIKKGSDISSEKDLSFNFLSKLEINLKEAIYLEELENKEYQQEYEFSIGYRGKNFETFVIRDNLKDEFDLKMTLLKNFENDYKLKFTTAGYEKIERSYQEKLNYDNYWISSDNKIEEFKSYGLKLNNDNFKIIVDSKEDDLNLIISLKEKYYNFFYISNLNKKDLNGDNETLSNFELTGKYSFGKIKTDISYSVLNDFTFSESDFINRNETLEFDTVKYINGSINYEVEEGKINLEFENKSAEDSLYNSIYSELSYDINENFNIKYKLEVLDVNGLDFYYNNYILLKNSIKNFDTYIYGKFINLKKEEFNEIGINKNKEEFEKENKYSEFIIKVRYGLFEKVDLKLATSLKEEDIKDDLDIMSYIEISYDYDKNTRVYCYYMQSDTSFDDRIRDLSGNFINTDYNNETGLINDFKNGKFEFGVELKF